MFALKRIFATLLAFFNLLFSTVIHGSPETDKTFRVTSYIIADRIQNAENLHTEDFDIITDVILFGCARFDSNGDVVADRTALECALANLREVTGDRDVKIHVNLLGPDSTADSDDYNGQMKDKGKRHTLAFRSGVLEDNVVALVDEYGFDGVYFDYEYPLNYVNWTPFNQFLVRLDGKLGDRILGLAVSDWDIKLSVGSFLAVDRFEVMLYDVFDGSGRHATTETVKEYLKNIKKYSIPKEKLGFGLPFYARPTDKSAYWYDYAGFCDALDGNGYLYDGDTGKTFWFNRPADIAEKTRLALDEGFGGVMIWHYSCDLPSSDSRSLLRAVGEAVSR